ncbi:ketopantoate reductase family protein [Priestia megaterium]
MKIAIAGSGAMGCRFGSMLFKTGNEILLIDKWTNHVETINNKGLKIINEDGTHIQRMKAFFPHEANEEVDLLIIFTKAMQTDSMINSCQQLINKKTIVLTLQNGLGNIEVLEKYISRDRLIAGVTTFGTELLGPGKIRAFGSGNVQIMQIDGKQKTETHVITNIFNQAGMNAEISTDVFISIWNKVALNCAINTLCTLMKSSVGIVGKYSEIEEVIEEIINEIVLVAHAENVLIEQKNIINMIINVFDPTMAGNHFPSMLQDMEKGRTTEIGYLNGAIVEKADRYQIPVPVNRLLTHLIKMMEETR